MKETIERALDATTATPELKVIESRGPPHA
jgi:hypothetical protein